MNVHRVVVLLCVLTAVPAAAFAQSSTPEHVQRFIDKWNARREVRMPELKKEVAAEQQKLKQMERGKVDRRATTTVMPANPKYVARFPTIQKKTEAVEKQRKRVQQLEAMLSKWETRSPETSPFITAGHDDPIELGDIGLFPVEVRLVQIVDDDTALAEIYDHTFFLEGVSLAGKTDDSEVRFDGLYEATGTKQYTTVAGGTRTILVLKEFDFETARKLLPKD